LLNPRRTWSNPAAYEARAHKLAAEFCASFAKSYSGKGIDPAVARECPGA